MEGYNGKYGSNPQGIKVFLRYLLEIDQIGREINGKNSRNYERRLQIDSTESRIIEFGLDFAEKSKFEVERKFQTLKS